MDKLLKNWSNFPSVEADMRYFDNRKELSEHLNHNSKWIARGLGRCYGDASLSKNVISTTKYNKFISFDIENGILECESGLSLDEILTVIVPEGWFLPVTPGTKFITVGGAVASDIHGKNHHSEGSFSRHIIELSVLSGDGTVYECNKQLNSDLFEATCGGMGLTGIVLTVKFKLKKIETSYISQQQIKARNLDEIIELFDKYHHYTYSVAWIDCLKKGKGMGRSILMLGEHATQDELPNKLLKDPLPTHTHAKFNVPVNFPSFTLNQFSVKAFNSLYYAKNYKPRMEGIVHYDPYFYPLDNILNWNKLYGKKGFVQYQFVLPLDKKEGLYEIIKRIASKNMGSFLAVLKVFGAQDSLISFPREGYTLALDFPMTSTLLPFLDELDSIVAENEGRVYLTKDARMDKEMFWSTYPNIDRFMEIVRKYNPDSKFSSLQSSRLGITL